MSNESNGMVDLRQLVNNKGMKHALMTEYQCHKKVHAIPMNLGTYNKVRGWNLPDDEDAKTLGYLVVYNRGTDDEYVSWSPKHIFDDGYTVIE